MNKVRSNKGFENSFPVETAADEFFQRLTSTDVPISITNFDDFVQDVFSKSYPEFSFNTWHIRHLCNQFQKVLDDPVGKYMLAVMPRYHLKSSILGYASSLYRMLTSTGGEGLYVSYKEELASIHCFHIKECVRKNEILSKFIRDLTPQSDSTINYMVGKKRIKIYSAGILGVKRGLHTQVICLHPGTLVLTTPDGSKKYSGGYKKIEEIGVGVRVKTHMNRAKKVTEIFIRDICEELVILRLSNKENVKITSNHPVLTKFDGWKKAGDLTIDDVLMKLKFFNSKTDGTRIEKIEKAFYSGKVYNLEVEDDNSYVGKGLIYHNCVGDDLMGDLQNPMTFTEIEKTIRIFEAELLNIPNKECPMVVFGTVISENDLLYRLKEKPQFNKYMAWMPALYPDGEHEVLWEDMYPRAWLEQRKIDGGWKAFNTEFLLVPVMSTEVFFNKEQLDTVIDKSLINYGVPGY